MHRSLSRRTALRAGTAGIVAALTARPINMAAQTASGEELRYVARRKGILIGGLADPNRILANVAPAAQRAFNAALLHRPLHWQNFYDQSGASRLFGPADQVVAFAQTSDLDLEIHHLNQGGFQRIDQMAATIPAWIQERVAADGGDPMPLLREHITAIVAHFADIAPERVRTYTVVNEVLNPWGAAGDFDWYLPDGSVTTGRSLWNQASLEYYGDPWFHVGESFRIAAEARAAAGLASNLIINELFAEQPDTSKGDGYLALVNSLVATGMPIDGVGFKMYLQPGTPYENGLTLQNEDEIAIFAAEFQRHVSRFPVPPFITEMSIDQSYWRQLGYSSTEARRLVGVTVRRVLEALVAGGGRSLMFADHSNIAGSNSFPDDDPLSPTQQMLEVLRPLPDVTG